MSALGRVASAPNVARADAGETVVEDAEERVAVWRGQGGGGRCCNAL